MKTSVRGASAALKISVCSLALGLAGTASAVDIGGASVTLSGRLVGGYDRTDNVARPDGSSGTVSRAASNQWGTSLLTIAAERPLTGGNTAYGKLESGFGTDSGNSGSIWSRRAYVGIKNDGWGSLQFGRNLSVSNAVWFIDPMAQNWSGSATMVGGRNWAVAPGAIEYATPKFGGAGAVLQYSPGGTVGDAKAGSKLGAYAFYESGPLGLHAIYDTSACASGQTSCTSGRYDNIYNASKEFIVGGTYQLGAAKLFAGWNRLSAPDANGLTAPKRADQVWVGVNYRVTDPLLLRAAFYRGKTDVDARVATADGGTPYGGRKGSMITLGADYSLDKNVLVWATLARMTNGSNSAYSSGNYWDSVPLPGANQSTVNFGLVLTF